MNPYPNPKCFSALAQFSTTLFTDTATLKLLLIEDRDGICYKGTGQVTQSRAMPHFPPPRDRLRVEVDLN